MKWLILLHVLGATIWVGGHLILSIGFLPKALREKNPRVITEFEKSFEKIGLPALLTQAITGIWMALIYVPFRYWANFDTPHHVYLWTKLGLLAGTLLLAIHARFFILPSLTDQKLPQLGFHIVLVTVLAVFFVITGLSFRFFYF
jgi:putative copper export protein